MKLLTKLVVIYLVVSLPLCSFGQEIEDIQSLILRLQADSGVSVDMDGVLHWEDISGNGNNASQINPDFQPELRENIPFLNNQSAFFFDGSDDVFLINNSIEIASCVIVFNSETNTITPFSGLITEQSGGPGSILIINSSGVPAFFTNGFFQSNFEVNAVPGSAYSNPTEYKYALGTSASQGSFSSLIIGNDRDQLFRNWHGNIAEILAFNQELSESEKETVYDYLIEKYTPVLDLGADITFDGFCPDSIGIDDSFRSYLWSTGETTPKIEVSESGTYILNTISDFGIESSDTIEVSFPGNFIQDFSLCIGNDSTWEIGLGNSNFTYQWNDMSVNSNFLIEEEGEYYVQVTDQNNCVFQSDTVMVDIDNFPNTASLGPDLSLCSGNTLQLISGQDEAVSYEWNDLSSDPELVVNVSGTYWVEAENENGCIAQDTIDVTIIGQAPTASFIANNFCLGEQVDFSDLSFPPGGETISSWTWDFGDGNGSNDPNPGHLFDDLGSYTVSLVVETPAGCADIFETEIQINPLPEVDFLVSNLCSDQDAFFDDNSTISNGNINNWSWDFGDSSSANGQNVGHTYAEPGSYNVTLTATSDVNCSNEQSITITINPSPVSNFTASSTCLGQATVFSQNIDTTIAGPIQIYAWDFDNGFTSNFPTTSQTYFVPGSFNVSLSVTSILGCVDDTVQIVNINDLPNAGFSNLNACIGESTLFMDTTNIFLTDSIAEWNWNFSNQGASDLANPSFTFNSTGNFNVSLEVTSQAGCEASAQEIITVFEDPDPNFEFDPTIGLPPLDVTFNNLTTDANDFVWNFGNGDSSLDFSPQYTYLDTGIFTIQLLAINNDNCSDTINKTILVIEPIFELDLADISCVIDNGQIFASAIVSNFGNHDINTFEINLNVGNGPRITETWNGLLRPGETLIYDFVAAPEYSPALHHEFLCSTVSMPNGNNRELTLENNTRCKALIEDEFILFPPYPNPNKGALNFDFLLPIDNLVILEIIDAQGRTIKYREIDGTNGHNNHLIHVPTLEVGSYLLRLSVGSNSQIQWFFVE